MHVLLALVIFVIALWSLAPKEPPLQHKKWMTINLALLLITVAIASTLKYVREHASRPAPVAGANRVLPTMTLSGVAQ